MYVAEINIKQTFGESPLYTRTALDNIKYRDKCDMVLAFEELPRHQDRDRYMCEYIESNAINRGKENLRHREKKQSIFLGVGNEKFTSLLEV